MIFLVDVCLLGTGQWLGVTSPTKEFVGDSYVKFEPTFDRTELHGWFSNLHLAT